MRAPQKLGSKGSLKWIQLLINRRADLLSDKICEQERDLQGETITWFSPLESDGFAEYRDGSFLTRLGFERLSAELAKFWPRLGPQWDALGMTSQGYPLLLEAKANIPELISHCGAKDPDSIRLIADRLKETQKWLACRSTKDWTRDFYQYANRLAHLYFLRELQGKDVFLVFVYFVNDTTHIPTSFQEWRGALQLQKKLMGLAPSRLRHVIDIFLDVNEIQELEQATDSPRC